MFLCFAIAPQTHLVKAWFGIISVRFSQLGNRAWLKRQSLSHFYQFDGRLCPLFTGYLRLVHSYGDVVVNKSCPLNIDFGGLLLSLCQEKRNANQRTHCKQGIQFAQHKKVTFQQRPQISGQDSIANKGQSNSISSFREELSLQKHKYRQKLNHMKRQKE